MDPSGSIDASRSNVPVNYDAMKTETSPSVSVELEQEVNKPLVDAASDSVQLGLEPSSVNQAAASNETGEVSNGIAEPETQGQPKKVKKNVNFPVDSTIIKNYLEPPDPWKNVPNWRTEDLLKAYRKSCERHGAKPLNKILQQLQCIENVGERYEILSLKGERMDLKQCECLEDIFRYVRFRCIDMEATHLDDEMAVALFEMVEYYESACKLNISFNKGIGPRGWMSCSRLVRKTPCLTFIDARNCDLNERVIPIMGRALRMGCFLQRLHLQSTGLSGRALVILVAALKMNEMLKELFIGDNKFMPTDGVQIGNLLKYNHTLELLDLRNNHLQDVGVTHICDGLSEQCLDTGLLTLVLWNNQITFQGMSAINKAVTSAEHLETLNLGHNPITNEGIHILKDGLLKTKSLLKLGLSGTKVSCEGAVALAEVIADNTRLVRLDLQENDIKTAGLMALSLALKVNESITRLDIDRDTKKESGVKDYADQQKRLQKDISSVLERNRDLLHKREEELRQLELKNQENARKLEEAACDIESSHEYIPSGDGIHRPKLLFIPHSHICPEHELDSPVLGEEFFLEASPPVASVTLTPPTGADLLSPQYCPNPKVTAKKIFSVTRVTSPTSEHGFMLPHLGSVVTDVINSPTQVHPAVRHSTDEGTVIPQLCSPLATVDLPTAPSTIPLTVSLPVSLPAQSPDSLQKVLQQHTLVSYIQQIVDTSKPTDSQDPVDTSHEQSQVESIADDHLSNNNIEANNEDKVHVDSSVDTEGDDDKANVVKDGGNTTNVLSGNIIVDTNNSEVVNECENEADLNINNTQADSASVSGETDANQNCSGSSVAEPKPDVYDHCEQVIDAPNVAVTCSNTSDNDAVCSSEIPKKVSHSHCDTTNNVQHSQPESLSELNMPSECEEESRKDGPWDELNGDFVDCVQNHSSNSSNVNKQRMNELNETNVENEPWDTVNKADLEGDSLPTSETGVKQTNGNNPDFHTNLSFNGLRQELASLIDEEGNTVLVAESDVSNGSIPNTESNTELGCEGKAGWLETNGMKQDISSPTS